jgi:O-antigen/teichoic acid export membrane protein
MSGTDHKVKYIKNVSWVLSGFVFRYGLNLIVSIYVARYLQPEGFGNLNYASTYLYLLTPLAFLGLHGIVTRDLVNGKFKENELLGTSFIIKAIASVAVFLLILIIIQFTEQKDTATKWNIIIASASLFASPFAVIDFFFQAKVKSRFIVYSQQIAYVLSSVVRLLLIFYKCELKAFVWMIFVDAILISLFLLIFYIKEKNEIRNWRYSKIVANELLKEIPKVIVLDFLVSFYMKIDQVVIQKMLGSYDLGVYVAAVKLSEPFYTVAVLLVASVSAAIVNGLKISQIEYESRVQKLFNILTWIAIATSIIVTLSSNLIIGILFDPSFQHASQILSLYFWSSVFYFQGVLAFQVYLIERTQIFAIIYALAGALINITLNIILIPIWGLHGAAYATLISYPLSFTLFNVVFPKTRHVFRFQMKSFMAIFTDPKSIIEPLLKKQK